MRHVRLILTQLKAEYPGVVITKLRQRKHLVFRLELPDGRTYNSTVAASPRDIDHCVNATLRQTRQHFAAQPEKTHDH